MATDHHIRVLIRDFLDGHLTFEEFEDAFLDETWDVRAEQLNEVPEIVFTVERYIAEFTGGYRSDDDLRNGLEVFAPAWVGSPRGVAWVESTTTPARRLTAA